MCVDCGAFKKNLTLHVLKRTKNFAQFSACIHSNWDERGEEGQPQKFLVRATFFLFSRPSHLEILVLTVLFFLSV